MPGEEPVPNPVETVIVPTEVEEGVQRLLTGYGTEFLGNPENKEFESVEFEQSVDDQNDFWFFAVRRGGGRALIGTYNTDEKKFSGQLTSPK